MNYFFILIPLLANVFIEVGMTWKVSSEALLISKRHRVRMYGIGMLAFGIIVMLQFEIVQVNTLLKGWMPNGTTAVVSAFAALVALCAAMVILKKQASVNQSLRIETSNAISKIFSGIVWMIYLICYESYFRILLLPDIQHSNAIGIIFINVFIYAALHLHRAKSEMIAAIPFGLFVCYCTMLSGSVWPAFLAHLVLAWVCHFGTWPLYGYNAFSKTIFHPIFKNQSL